MNRLFLNGLPVTIQPAVSCLVRSRIVDKVRDFGVQGKKHALIEEQDEFYNMLKRKLFWIKQVPGVWCDFSKSDCYILFFNFFKKRDKVKSVNFLQVYTQHGP